MVPTFYFSWTRHLEKCERKSCEEPTDNLTSLTVKDRLARIERLRSCAHVNTPPPRGHTSLRALPASSLSLQTCVEPNRTPESRRWGPGWAASRAERRTCQPHDFDLPGIGKHYRAKANEQSKPLKNRLKELREKPYSHAEAEVTNQQWTARRSER